MVLKIGKATAFWIKEKGFCGYQETRFSLCYWLTCWFCIAFSHKFETFVGIFERCLNLHFFIFNTKCFLYLVFLECWVFEFEFSLFHRLTFSKCWVCFIFCNWLNKKIKMATYFSTFCTWVIKFFSWLIIEINFLNVGN